MISVIVQNELAAQFQKKNMGKQVSFTRKAVLLEAEEKLVYSASY